MVDTGVAVAIGVRVTGDTLSVELADGRTIAAPLAWYPRLAHGTAKQRKTWRFIGGGRGIHWPDLDEEISVANLLSGQPSGESQASLKKWLAGRQSKKTRRKRPDMLTENDVVQAVAGFLRGESYRIDCERSTVERGVDIVAVHPRSKRRVLVEAKDATSSKSSTARFGKPFTPNQARSYVSVALYCAARLRR
jgi:hypothetical protein